MKTTAFALVILHCAYSPVTRSYSDDCTTYEQRVETAQACVDEADWLASALFPGRKLIFPECVPMRTQQVRR